MNSLFFFASIISYNQATGQVTFSPAELVTPLVIGVIGIVSAVVCLWIVFALARRLADSMSGVGFEERSDEIAAYEVSERQQAVEAIRAGAEFRARRAVGPEPVFTGDDEPSDWEFRDGGRYDGF